MGVLSIRYRQQWLSISVAVDRTTGGALSGILADLASVTVQLVWPAGMDLDLRDLEGAEASLDGDARYRVRQCGQWGNVVRFQAEPVELQDQPAMATAGISQDRWPVAQTIEAIAEYPHFQITRTGPPDASVNLAYPVLYGQVGAWVTASGMGSGEQSTPVIPLDSTAQNHARSIVLAVSDGSPTLSGTLPVLPIAEWPVTIAWTSGSVEKSASYDGSTWTGDGTTGSVNATTGAYSFVLGPDTPDVDAEITISGTWAAYRAVVASGPVDAVRVDVGGFPHDVAQMTDGAGQTISIVWLAGEGSTTQAINTGSALEARWLYGDPHPAGAGDLLCDLARASRVQWDWSALEGARSRLNRYRVVMAFTEPTTPMESVRTLLNWLPLALVDSGSGLSPALLDFTTPPTRTIVADPIGEVTTWGSEDIRGLVRVRWQGGSVDTIADPSRSDVVEIEAQVSDEASARLVAAHHARVRGRVWRLAKISVTRDALPVLSRVWWQSAPAIVLQVQYPASDSLRMVVSLLY